MYFFRYSNPVSGRGRINNIFYPERFFKDDDDDGHHQKALQKVILSLSAGYAELLLLLLQMMDRDRDGYITPEDIKRECGVDINRDGVVSAAEQQRGGGCLGACLQEEVGALGRRWVRWGLFARGGAYLQEVGL